MNFEELYANGMEGGERLGTLTGEQLQILNTELASLGCAMRVLNGRLWLFDTGSESGFMLKSQATVDDVCRAAEIIDNTRGEVLRK